MSIRIMSHPWLLLAFSWIGSVSLQYIESGSPAVETPLELTDSGPPYPLPYTQFFNQPPNYDAFHSDMAINYQEAQQPPRKRRTLEDPEARSWRPNLVDTDKTVYYRNNVPPIVIDYNDDNQTEVEKKNFSPWGGKRDKPQASFGHMWSWKRSQAIREPSMPKRVRFSPWGGKRSGQMIYKPGVRASKIIFFSTIPELKRIVTNYSPETGKQFGNFEFVPGMDKRHPISILAMSSNGDISRTLRDALPFNSLTDSSPKLFKPGHPYNDVHLKKDGKRKMKFSIWGGKRSPPIIGPIWTPASEDSQDKTLNTILLLRNKATNEQQNTQ